MHAELYELLKLRCANGSKTPDLPTVGTITLYSAATGEEWAASTDGAEWKMVGGGAPALIGDDGEILAGCPGLEDENIAELGAHEDPENREQREQRQEQAEAGDYEPKRVTEAKKAYADAVEEAPDDALVLLRVGERIYAFGPTAAELRDCCEVGNGEMADFDHSMLDGYIDKLVAKGHRIGVAERVGRTAETEPVRTEEPEEFAGYESSLERGEWDEPEQTTPGEQGEAELVYDEFEDAWVPRDQFEPAQTTEAEPEREAKPKRQGKQKRITGKMREAIIEAVGDDPTDIKEFAFLVEEVHERKVAQVTRENEAYEGLLGEFINVGQMPEHPGKDATKDELRAYNSFRSKANGKRGAFIRTLQKLDDYDGIKRFDEMVEVAADRYPELLDFDTGESSGQDDAEQALFRRLQRGILDVPAKHDESVISEALDYVNRYTREGFSADFGGDLTKVPFAATRENWWTLVRFQARLHHETQQRGRREKAEKYRAEAPQEW